MRIFRTDGFSCYRYYKSPDYDFLPDNFMGDYRLAELLYIIYSRVEPQSVGFNPVYLRTIPNLTLCKILKDDCGKPALNIPVLSPDEAKSLDEILHQARAELVSDLTELLWEFLKGKGVQLPKHLDSVPEQKRYMCATNAMLFATVREAMMRGKLYDGNYDDDSN